MKKRLHNSRRGRALLYALLLVVVILVSSTAGFYRILPQQAILERAEEQGIETLEPVMWIRGENPIGTGPARLTLSVGERTLFFCPVKFYLWGGWSTGAWGIVETWEGEDPYFGVWQHVKTSATYVFGQVDDPAVKTLTIHDRADNGTTWSQEVAPDWQEKDGERYFITELKNAPLDWAYSVTAEDGNTVEIEDVFCWW